MLSVGKQRKLDNFIQWLKDNDVQFIERANGHIQIFDNNERFMDVWATTERAKHTSGEGYAGIYSIQKQILDTMRRV